MSEKKTLFNEYEAMNEEAHKLDVEVRDALLPIIDKWLGQGYSTIELDQLISSIISVELSERRIRNAMKMRRRK